MVTTHETGHRLRPWFNSRPGLQLPSRARGDDLFGGGDAGEPAAVRGGEVALRAGFPGKEQAVIQLANRDSYK